MPSRGRMLLDTGILTTLLSEKKRYSVLQAEIRRQLDGFELCVCSIVKGEFSIWANRLGPRRRDIAYGFVNSLHSYPITDRTAEFYASNKWDNQQNISPNDKWIGSVIMEHSKLRLCSLDSDYDRATHLKKRIVRIDQKQFML